MLSELELNTKSRKQKTKCTKLMRAITDKLWSEIETLNWARNDRVFLNKACNLTEHKFGKSFISLYL